MAEENTEENVQELSGTEKSVLMMLLGEDEAAAVLQKLTPREVQHLGTAMYSVRVWIKQLLMLFLMSF